MSAQRKREANGKARAQAQHRVDVRARGREKVQSREGTMRAIFAIELRALLLPKKRKEKKGKRKKRKSNRVYIRRADSFSTG